MTGRVLTSSSSVSSRRAAACGRAWPSARSSSSPSATAREPRGPPSSSSSRGSPGGTHSACGAARCTRSAAAGHKAAPSAGTGGRGPAPALPPHPRHAAGARAAGRGPAAAPSVRAAGARSCRFTAAPLPAPLPRPVAAVPPGRPGSHHGGGPRGLSPRSAELLRPAAASAAKRAGRQRKGPGWKRFPPHQRPLPPPAALWFLPAERWQVRVPRRAARPTWRGREGDTERGEAGAAPVAAWVCRVGTRGREVMGPAGRGSVSAPSGGMAAVPAGAGPQAQAWPC